MAVNRLPLLIGLALLGGCASPTYYLQAVHGQLELWRLSQPLEALEGDPSVKPALKDKLASAVAIRDFASRALHLPNNGSYRKYADVKRQYVVWNVFAAEAFSIQPKQWCYPIAGCAAYRGYFDKAEAEQYARSLRERGYDAHVGGVPAYSTLGWFDDPLLNTFIHYPETELARLIFHELSHQVLYVAGDTEFNESFAVAVEQTGVRRWLEHYGSPAQREAFERAQARRADFTALVLDYREKLGDLYESDVPEEEKRTGKARILAELKEHYTRLKTERWGGFAGYDRWFGQEINNATLASVGIYTKLVPAFLALLEAQGGDLPRFYTSVKRLADMPKDSRREQLAQVLDGSRAPVALLDLPRH